MQDMLKMRGKQMFTTKINEVKKSLPEEYVGRLEILQKYFEDKVTIIENSKWETFAAGRLAAACISVIDGYPPKDETETIDTVLKLYNETQISHVVTRTEETIEQKAINKRLTEEIRKNEINYEKYDTYDLLQDVDKAGLTTEGKRVKGFLPSTFDSTVDDEEDCEIDTNEDELPDISFIYDDYQNKVFVCPICSSSNLFFNTVTGSCFDCDAEFKLGDMNLNDNLPEKNEESGWVFDEKIGDFVKEEPKDITENIFGNYVNNMIKRASGEKKNRGIIVPGDPDFED